MLELRLPRVLRRRRVLTVRYLSAVVVDGDGAEVGELLVWVSAGLLSVLELAWWTDSAPTSLPSVTDVRLSAP